MILYVNQIQKTMNFKLLGILFLLIALSTSGQVNFADSTVYVNAFWKKGDKRYYTLLKEKIKVSDSDTIFISSTTSEFEIKVLDVSKRSYTLEWAYTRFDIDDDNETVRRILNEIQPIKYIYKTDKQGVFLELVNWKEIEKFCTKVSNILKKELNDPAFEKILKQVEASFFSKAAIESSLKDVRQFHAFHGAHCKLGELSESEVKIPNIFTEKPFDVQLIMTLESIGPSGLAYSMRSKYQVDEEQLMDATYNYLTRFSGSNNIELPLRSELGSLKNEIKIFSIINASGWVYYSIQNTTVGFGDEQDITFTTIKAK